MASPAHGFEKIEQQASQPESGAEVLEIVHAPTPEETIEMLDAGAAVVVSQNSETRPVKAEGFGPDHETVKMLYVTASPDRIEDLASSQAFGKNWELDATTYAPYASLKSSDRGTMASVFAKLGEVLGKNAKLEPGDNYVWNKRQDAMEKESGDGQEEAMGAGAGAR